MSTLLTHRIPLQTAGPFHWHDITAELQGLVERSRLRDGLLLAAGQHTTTSLVVNENEPRLHDDIRRCFLDLASAERPYRHNDLEQRPGVPPDEPRNAHGHLIAWMLANHLSPSAKTASGWVAIRQCCWWS